MLHRYPDALNMNECKSLVDNGPLDILPPSMDLPILPRPFSVPPLTDEPQNPIINRLNQEKDPEERYKSWNPLLQFQTPLPTTSVSSDAFHDIWLDALTRNLGLRKKALSWDALRSSYPIKATSTGFLTEQDALVFAAARYRVSLPLRDTEVDMLYVTQANLLSALKMIVLGTSSIYHIWDAPTERFVQAGLGDHKRGLLLMDGADEVVSQSLISRFLTIGNLLRRLETLLASIRTRSSREDPTVHAYTHALSTTLNFLRHALARCPPANGLLSTSDTLSAIWSHYEVYQEILVALADLNGRAESTLPQDYPVFDPSPVTLLSTIYNQLDCHIERQSSRVVIAIFAFMITHVSHEYLQHVSRSVGYCADPVQRASRIVRDAHNAYQDDEYDDESVEEGSETRQLLGDVFPSFFPKNLKGILPAAQKSLVLLESAQPDHPILRQTTTRAVIHWFWSQKHLESAWKGDYPNFTHDGSPGLNARSPTLGETDDQDPNFLVFRFFDLEPGTQSAFPSTITNATTTRFSLESFVEQFPAILPSITPTLSQLTSLILAPLVEHASNLSSALLDLFLSPPTTRIDTLNFETHIVLLRSYLLVTSMPFKSRMAAALFSDREDPDYDHKPHGMSIRYLRRKSSRKKPSKEPSQCWAVGLAPSLLERETWPPVGADLSFFLRTVIVDSFVDGNWDERSDLDASGETLRSRVLEEAEYRLGFAIRDLPIGPGRDRWLNPLSIEALDFLYMDYKPPNPLEVLITPEILSKYQRVFTFILRLMRVEHALCSLFRMTRAHTKPLFPTLVSSRKRLLHFRFVAHSFISNLSAYVFDVAIGGNFDPFILCLQPRKGGHHMDFSDVFTLTKRHSVLLDDVLSACLLRSSQRAIGEVLRNMLELVLEFTVVIGELFRGRIEEYQATLALEEIWTKFSAKMRTFVKALKGLVDKNGSLLNSIPSHSSYAGDPLRKPVGGVDALYQLIVRLDLGDWWSKSSPRAS